MNKEGSKRSEPNKQDWIVDDTCELLGCLLKVLAGKSRNSVKAVLTRGQVSVNGKVQTKHNYKLTSGDSVRIDWSRQSAKVKMSGIEIIYEDGDLIVIEKEAGLLSIATDEERENTAYRELMKYVQQTDPKSRIFIIHRLDRDTSGIMMFAKSKKIQQLLQNSWHESVKERTYVALVEGTVGEAGTITSWLKENKQFMVTSSRTPNGGKKAVTHYKVIKSNKTMSLLQVQLETGRKNQIRVHMREIGHPIVGDKKYGSSVNPIGRIGLHAQALAFMHPATGEALRFETNVPAAFARGFRSK
ncbi:RluA family pseudouridine synthase [bacterium LRH843]|nr:RluA family pseudouridine synthase [bacterium LRH843]